MKREDRDYATGDLIEIYDHICGLCGPASAKKAILKETLLSMPGFLRSSIAWRITMFGNYFKTTLRNMMRHKGFSVINITGLSIGLAGCILMLLWIGHMDSIDKYLPGWEKTHQVLMHGMARNNPSTPAPLAPLLGEEYPEIESVTRMAGTREMLVDGPEGQFYESGINGVDETFFEVFPFEFIYGDPKLSLKDPGGIVLTRTIAEKYFPGVNPVGQSLTLDKTLDFTVTGVVQDVPDNSSIDFKILFPIERKYALDSANGRSNGWETFNTNAYLRLGDGVTAGEFNPKIVDFVPRHYEPYDDVEISVIRFSDRMDLFSRARQYTYLITVIAIFVLVIACINFTNLSTAKSANRAKEIGVRKVAGAGKMNLINQFIGESVFISFIALGVAVIIVIAVLPYFSARAQIDISVRDLTAPGTIILMMALTLVTGLISGVYPAFFLSSLPAIRVLKGLSASGRNRGRLRSGMVVFQFILASLMITGTGTVFRQFQFIRMYDAGFDRENIVNIDLRGETSAKYPVLKQELLRGESIENVSGSIAGMPYFSWSTGSVKWDGLEEGEKHIVYFNGVDYDFVEMFSIDVLAGRAFSRDIPGDENLNIVINESMAELIRSSLMGDGSTGIGSVGDGSTGIGSVEGGSAEISSVVGRRVNYWDRDGTILGVVRNFHFQTMDNSIKPMMLILTPDDISVMSVKLDPGDVQGGIRSVREIWEANLPGYPFEYDFIDNMYAGRYSRVRMTRNVFGGFSLLAVFVACMGLLGLASFIADKRSKEIGIRKVLGANDLKISGLLLKEFVVCVIIANIVSMPLSWLVTRQWLQNYAYRISPGIELFIVPLVLTLVVSLLTVSWQTMRAVRKNPVDSLKYE